MTTACFAPTRQHVPIPRILDFHPPEQSIRDVVLHGLTKWPKSLPCRLLYDARGSELFERICELPEYYLTRTELCILRNNLPEIAEIVGPGATVIEYGSGAGVKSRLLLDSLERPAAYFPIDISRSALRKSARQLQQEFPHIEMTPVCADYTQQIELPKRRGSRPIVFFPGSTIGNFTVRDAARFMMRSAQTVGKGGGMLVGVDLIKDRETLEAAYNDSQGVTAEFNLNLLHRMNRELDADFEVDAFGFVATYNERRHRIESYLFSKSNQIVHIDGSAIEFDEGELIHTEYSYKYTLQMFTALAAAGGFRVKKVWTDPQCRFSVQYLEVD